VAGGEDPSAGRWVASGGTPDTALLSLQLGCSSAAADRGAFDYQQESPLQANGLATAQAVPAAAGTAFPLSHRRLSATEPTVSCPSGAAASPTTTVASSVASTATPVTTPPATLPRTGADPWPLASVALALMGVGALLVASRFLERKRSP